MHTHVEFYFALVPEDPLNFTSTLDFHGRAVPRLCTSFD
jgi:hypothetical protein